MSFTFSEIHAWPDILADCQSSASRTLFTVALRTQLTAVTEALRDIALRALDSFNTYVNLSFENGSSGSVSAATAHTE